MKLADWILKFRFPILVAGIITWGASGYFASKLETNYSFWTLFVSHDPEIVKLQRYVKQWGEDSAVMFLALRSKTGHVITPDNLARIKQLQDRFESIAGIDEVTSLLSVVTVTGKGDSMHIGPLVDSVPRTPAAAAALDRAAHENRLVNGTLLSDNDRTTVIALRIHHGLRDAKQRNPIVEEVNDISKQVTRGSDMVPYLTGIPTAQWVYSTEMVRDLFVFTGASVLLLALILAVMFRNLSGVLLPLSVVAAATTATMATLYLSGQQINMINTAIPTLMLVIGIADGIHLMAHYRQRLAAGDSIRQAIRLSFHNLGWACLLTSLTTAVGFGSLVSAHIATVRNFGVYAGIGVMYAFVANILIIPIGLSLLKPHPADISRAGRDTSLVRGLLWLGRLTQARPWTTLILTGVVLAVFGYGMSLVKVQSRMFEEISNDDPVVIANHKLQEDLPGVVSYALDVTTPPGEVTDPANLKALDRLAHYAESQPAVDRAMGLADLVKEMNRATHGGDPAYYEIPDNKALIDQYLLLAEGDATKRLVNTDYSRTQVWMRGPEVVTPVWEKLRHELERRAKALAPRMQIVVTGSSSMAQRALASIIHDVLTSLGWAFVVILVLMSLLFRSLRIGLLSMIPNVIPLLVTVGIMGFWGINLRTSTVVIFSISIGLAVDDTIHFLVRYRRERAAGLAVSPAVLETLRTTGRPIVYTSLLLIGGFWVLILSSFNATRDVGLLGGVTLVTALLADLIVLPALVKVALGWREVASTALQTPTAKTDPQPQA